MSRPPSPPPSLPGFTYLESLGTGGFADVFLYEQEMPRRKVAVKVLLADRITGSAVEEFTAEANVMAMLSTHPAIVTIYQAGVATDGRPYLVMEYCPRPNLQVRARRERFPVAEALRVGIQVAGAVETAHRAGVLHRDIKPANILVTEYNRPALTDFGIASTVHGVGEATGMSIPWSPPETFADPPRSGPRSDVWALGATVFTLLTGRSPFEQPGGRNSGADLIERIERGPLPSIDRADAPGSLQAALERAMAKNPDDRFASAVAFARALQKVQIELSHSVTPVDIVDDQPHGGEVEEDDDGLTRVREVTSIAPESRTRPSATTSPLGRPAVVRNEVSSPRFESPSADEATVMRPPKSIPADDVDDDPTVMRAPQSIAPRQPVPPQPGAYRPAIATPAPGPAPGQAAPQADAAVPPAEQEAAAHAARARTVRAAVWSAVGVVVVAVVVVGSMLIVGALNAAERPDPSASETSDPQDVIGAVVPEVADVKGTVEGETVTFTWTNPDPRNGDSYLWYVVDLAGNGEPGTVTEETVTVPVSGSGATCIEVILRRDDARASAPVRGCAP